MEAGVVYVVCDADAASGSVQRYKIGKHTGSREDLIKRYKTYLPRVEVLRFVSVPRARMVEAYIQRTLVDSRIDQSEWFQIDESDLLTVFDNCVDEFIV